MRYFLAAFTTLVLVSKLFAEPEIKGSPTELAAYLAGLPKTVSIAGESELKVPADRAVVMLKVTTEHRSLQETLRANQELRGRITGILKERGISAEKIQASRFSSTAKTGPFSDKAKSYRVENNLKVKVQDEKEFQAVAQIVDTIAEAQYLGVDFEQSDKDAFRNKALALALDNAAERKRVFEERLGVKLIPRSFSQSTTPLIRHSQTYGLGSYVTDFGGSASKRASSLPAAEPGVVEDSSSLFGEMVFAARVTVEYAVESK